MPEGQKFYDLEWWLYPQGGSSQHLSYYQSRNHPTSRHGSGAWNLLRCTSVNEKDHIARVAQTCFFICFLLSKQLILECEVTASFVISRLDCCNFVLAHLMASTLVKLQRVLKAAARLVMDFEPCDQMSPNYTGFHLLREFSSAFWYTMLSKAQHQRFRLNFDLFHLFSIWSVATGQHPWSCYTPLSWKAGFICSASARVFSVAGPKPWNKLPVDITLTTNMKFWKRNLKQFCFQLSMRPMHPSQLLMNTKLAGNWSMLGVKLKNTNK